MMSRNIMYFSVRQKHPQYIIYKRSYFGASRVKVSSCE